MILLADTEGPDETARMHRLIWELAVLIWPKTRFALRKHTYSNILRISDPKTENFRIINYDIFHISAQSIDFGYSLEPPR